LARPRPPVYGDDDLAEDSIPSILRDQSQIESLVVNNRLPLDMEPSGLGAGRKKPAIERSC
jgi:hypothetical protein